MEENQIDRVQSVSSQVTAGIEDQDVRELWHRLSSELTRKGGGPDACYAYLESELTRMEGQIQRALTSTSEAKGG
ncbi:hypothetical protein M1N21_00350 [Dehalococcoidia bacterium]|nr:hypothetical protein [Dehalococcoidia bacterium]